jgi:hypothetical protein
MDAEYIRRPKIVQRPIIIGCDNQSCIRMAINPVLHEGTKHIEGTCYYLRDYIKKERIELRYVSMVDQQPNILTKALPQPRFK